MFHQIIQYRERDVDEPVDGVVDDFAFIVGHDALFDMKETSKVDFFLMVQTKICNFSPSKIESQSI